MSLSETLNYLLEHYEPSQIEECLSNIVFEREGLIRSRTSNNGSAVSEKTSKDELLVARKIEPVPFDREKFLAQMLGVAKKWSSSVSQDAEQWPPDGVTLDLYDQKFGTSLFLTGNGEIMTTHEKGDCFKPEACVIHNPSDHHMRAFKTHWRFDRGIMERICSHGVGHPDPDGLAYVEATDPVEESWVLGVHGCDGCCAKPITIDHQGD